MSVKQKLGVLKEVYINNNSISNREQFGIVGGLFGNAMGQDSTDTFADKFERTYMGIDNARMMAKGNVKTVLGFFIPPVAGMLYDLPVKPGRRSSLRTALQIAPIPFAVTSMLLFVVPSSSPLFNFIWTLFFSIFFSIADTFYDIALSALSLKMVKDQADRKKFYTLEAIATTLGSMAPGGVIPIFLHLVGDDTKKQQAVYFFMALGFCIIGIAAMYAPFLTIKEKAFRNIQGEVVRKENETKVTWNRNTVLAILHNRPFIILQLATIFELIRQITYRLLNYLYEDVFDDFAMKPIVDAISGTLSYVGLMAVPFLGRKLSPRTMLAGGYLYTACFYAVMSLFNINFSLDRLRKWRYLPGLCIGFAGVPNAAQGAAKRIMMAETTDYMEWYAEKHYGEPVRSDGLISAAQNIVGKFASLLKENLYNSVFMMVGYREGTPGAKTRTIQSNDTLRKIYLVFSLFGLIGDLLPASVFLFDNYRGKRKEAILAELEEMRARRAEAALAAEEAAAEEAISDEG